MRRSTNRLSMMRRSHLAQVRLAVQKYGPISRAQLARTTGISMACVCGLVDELLLGGVLVETGTTIGRRGGPSVQLEINAEGAPIAGVWLSWDTINTVIANPRAEILAQKTVQYNCGGDYSGKLISILAKEIRECAEAAGKEVDSLAGVGLSVEDMYNPMLGEIVSMRDWNGLPVTQLLSKRVKLPVYADHDVRAAALGAAWLGEVPSYGGIYYIIMHWAFGCAFVNNHSLLRGAHDLSGQIGEMILDHSLPATAFGRPGSLYSLVNDLAFIHSIWPDLMNEAAVMPSHERAALAQKAVHLAMSGDTKAYAALADFAKYLGVAVANIVNTLDPQTVVIGGTLVDAGTNTLLDLVRKEALNHVWGDARGVEIKALSDYHDFLVRGSIAQVLLQHYSVLQEDGIGSWSKQPARR